MATFVQAMNALPLTKSGVKGSDVYTKEGVGDLRVALFQLLVRGCTSETIQSCIYQAFNNPLVTNDMLCDYVVMAFQTRDIRGGKGERDLFYSMLLCLFKERPTLVEPLIALIPEYGCWLDCWKLWTLCESSVNKIQIQNAICELVKHQYFEDLAKLSKDEAVSLLGKWLPRQKSKYNSLAVYFASVFHRDQKQSYLSIYRKNCSRLNKQLKTVEVNMCSGTWSSIDPGIVPGRLMSKARKAFLNEIVSRKGKPVPKCTLRNPESTDRMLCREHFQEYTAKALNGEVKMNGVSTVYPHEIVNKFLHQKCSEDETALLQAQWNAIRDTTAKEGGLRRCVPMSDFSGSMNGVPLVVSMALGILISEINHPAFKDYLLGFDSNPSWIDFTTKKTLEEKVKYARRFGQGISTDFQAACDLILRRLVEHKVPVDEAPQDLIVFTDMGFDAAVNNSSVGYYTGNRYTHNTKNNAWQTHIQMIRNNFASYGYQAPRIVLWNLRAEYKDYHARATEEGVVLLSGWSPAVLKAITKGGVSVQTPYQALRELLDDSRYDKVREAWSKGCHN
jgi:hypothetical protein